jgi:hypothetical protein
MTTGAKSTARLEGQGSQGAKVVQCVQCQGDIPPFAGRLVSLVSKRYAHHPGQCTNAGLCSPRMSSTWARRSSLTRAEITSATGTSCIQGRVQGRGVYGHRGAICANRAGGCIRLVPCIQVSAHDHCPICKARSPAHRASSADGCGSLRSGAVLRLLFCQPAIWRAHPSDAGGFPELEGHLAGVKGVKVRIRRKVPHRRNGGALSLG